MAWNLQHLHFQPEKISGRVFFDHEIRLDRFDLEFEAEAAKEFPIGNHRRGLSVATDWAIEAAFDFSDVLDVIDMSMREQQKFWIEMARFEPIASAIGRIKQNPAFRRLNQIAIGLENAAAEGFVSHGRRFSFASKLALKSRFAFCR
jgi:hypothetical protein